MPKPRVLLADDHVLVLEGFRRILQEHYELVGTVGDGYALLAAAKTVQPDIVILDISMPLLNGIDTAAQLKKDLSNRQDHYRDDACRCGLCAIGLRGRSVGLCAQGVGSR